MIGGFHTPVQVDLFISAISALLQAMSLFFTCGCWCVFLSAAVPATAVSTSLCLSGAESMSWAISWKQHHLAAKKHLAPPPLNVTSSVQRSNRTDLQWMFTTDWWCHLWHGTEEYHLCWRLMQMEIFVLLFYWQIEIFLKQKTLGTTQSIHPLTTISATFFCLLTYK